MSNRYEKLVHDLISFKMSEVASEGILTIYNTSKPGFVSVPVFPSGSTVEKCAGLLTSNVVNKDFSAIPENHQRPNEVGLSGQVRLILVGEVETDQVNAGDVPGQGSGAYITTGGLLTTTATRALDGLPNERVGTFLNSQDANGLVRVWLNIN